MQPFMAAATRCLGALMLAAIVGGCDDSGERPASTAPTSIAQSAPARQASPRGTVSVPVGTGFDFYVLSLSWSPSYCEAEGEDANGQQCNSGRSYGFVVHGLWPQFEKGWPENCDAEPAYVADEIVRSLRDIMPSGGLIGYQWRKHGGCAGLSQEDYFSVLRAAREKTIVPKQFRAPEAAVTIDPDAVEASFIDANPGLPARGIAVICEDRYVSEVRLCMTRDLSSFRTCPEVDRRSCAITNATMPPVGG